LQVREASATVKHRHGIGADRKIRCDERKLSRAVVRNEVRSAAKIGTDHTIERPEARTVSQNGEAVGESGAEAVVEREPERSTQIRAAADIEPVVLRPRQKSADVDVEFASLFVHSLWRAKSYFLVPLKAHAFSLDAKFATHPGRRFSVEAEVRSWWKTGHYR
jgi:hypothetical protein